MIGQPLFPPGVSCAWAFRGWAVRGGRVSLAGFQRCLCQSVKILLCITSGHSAHRAGDSSSCPTRLQPAPPFTRRAHDLLERRSSVSLALIFALRMLGLFLVLPVLRWRPAKYPGGDDPALVGWLWAFMA